MNIGDLDESISRIDNMPEGTANSIEEVSRATQNIESVTDKLYQFTNPFKVE